MHIDVKHKKTNLYKKLNKSWDKIQKDIDAAANMASRTHMCAMQKALTAHSVEWKDCLRCILCILDEALEGEEACNITLADLRQHVEEEEERRLHLVKNGHGSKDASNQEHDPAVAHRSCRSEVSHKSQRTVASAKSCHSEVSHRSCGSEVFRKYQQIVSSHKSQDTVGSNRSCHSKTSCCSAASHKSRHTEAPHKSSHSIAHGRSSYRHKTDATKLVEVKIDAMLAAKRAEFAKREETLRREAGQLQAEKDDREVQIKLLCKAFKTKEMAARAKLLQDGC
ncbi:UNVERIFIED_CONTAM: hypothetical protein K2H54_045066 [Gekko kuhli]